MESEEVSENQERGVVSELIRKLAVAGLGAAVLTEEGLRQLAGQLRLPKDLLSGILSQADKTKEELARIIGEEIRQFLNSELAREGMAKLLEDMKLEVKAEIQLVPRNKTGPAEPAKKANPRRGG
ncbi:MAG: hypothetical protein FWG75_04055 [Cystobacterineae bacterium]|nr:hypothetical protein [Cystobacterineae bacterium]